MQFLSDALAKIKPGKNTWKGQACKLLKLIEEQEVLFTADFEDYDPAEYEDQQFDDWSANMADAIATAYRPTHYTCCKCGTMNERTSHGGMIGNYRRGENGGKKCLTCATAEEVEHLESMQIGGKYTAYFVKRGEQYFVNIVNLDIPVTPRKSKTNLHHVERFDFWFKVGPNYFHGKQIGYNNQIAHIQCVKPF